MNNAKELKEILINNYKYKIEMHAHTYPVSKCSEISPETLVETYHKKGYDAVVITNHFAYELMEGVDKEHAIDLYLEAYETAKKTAEKYDIKVFLGAEIKFTENRNDYLLYGVDRNILSVTYDYLQKGVEAFRKEVNLPDSVFLQAHPFRNNMELCNPDILDGIETFNMHPNHNSRVAVATRYANEQNFAITVAGTDYHHPTHEASCALRTPVIPDDSYGIAKMLRGGNYIFEVGETAIVLP